MCAKLFDSISRTSYTSPSPAEVKAAEAELEAWIQERQLAQHESSHVIWGRYVRRLRVKARAYLISQSMGGRDQDNLAFRTANAMFDATEKQELDPGERSSDLWKILLARAAREIQQSEQSETVQLSLTEVLGEAPSAQLCIRFAQELEQTIRLSLDDRLRNVLFLRLEGCVSREIAQRLGQQEDEVEPQLAEIRQRLATARDARM
ncbi:hypothetical protein DTL21_28660 [Bremerella cremea]|uniref:RNA polymerase sigma-70 ECF-like HTH domain-containing protein n=1 Tax=Blastopirellula marina TaxID=124 RepID=A0A2S8F8T7_9BACT|nr:MULTISPECIES: ECF-type sigma factor [Pirellulaceae]PQO28569.1 hypothetical protein C5Y83_28610 [Blastopirellula marina]RCS41939.1 hypothetical protein DTL21_28660 [Bremerella cremea]